MRKILNFMMVTFAMITLAACQRSGVNTALAQTTAEAAGPGIVNSRMETEVGPGVVSDQADTSAAAIETAPQEETSEAALAENEKTRIRIAAEENTIVFELNDSAAAKSLYRQLPLSLDVENFSNNEKIFYPPEKLDVTDTPQAASGVGTLAYYAPWGDVVMFYGDYSLNGQLYELGQAVSGTENIHSLSGILLIEKDE